MAKSVICVGEIMLELSGVKSDGPARFGFGGDTGNTAIYLARLLGTEGHVGYLTRLGQGPFSNDLAQAILDEQVHLSPATQAEAGTPGLYAISTDANGERSFTYWRRDAAARGLMSGGLAALEAQFLSQFEALYFSGISLAILSDEGRDKLLRIAGEFKAQGRTVMFDVNFRPHLWQSHAPHIDVPALMRRVIEKCSVVKIGQDESEALFGVKDAAQTVSVLGNLGGAALVITDGPKRIFAFEDNEIGEISFEAVDDVVDSTAAGDSFSAGFLAAKMAGSSIDECVRAGQRLAAEVIRHPGAIIPKDCMPT